MSSPPVGPVRGVPPVSAAGSLLRAEILAVEQATLEAALDGSGTPAATPKAGTAALTAPATGAPPTAAPRSAPAPPNPAAQAVDAARATAAQRQGSLAPLFADLAQAVSSPALPPALRAVISQVLALRTPLAAPLTAETVRQAVAQSGLFLEAHLAQAAPDAPPPDLKAALLTLQAALAALPTARTPAPPQPTAPAPALTAPPAAPPTAAAAPTAPLSPPVIPAATSDPKAALLNLQVAPPAEAAPAPVSAASPPQTPSPAQPAPQAAQTAPQPPPADLGPRLTVLQVDPTPAAARADPQTPGSVAEPAAAIPPPPHRAAALAAQAAVASSLPPEASAPAIVQHLQAGVEQAVARQSLHQLASLPDGQTTAWMFELPLATPQGTAIAQFEIQRDGARPQAGDEAVQGWRLRFSIDIEPLGPVHVHLGLNGDQARVMVWAEREASLPWLRQGAAALATALPAEVVFHTGAPRRPPPAPGRFVDQAL